MKPGGKASWKAEYFADKHNIGRAGNFVFSLNLLIFSNEVLETFIFLKSSTVYTNCP